MRTLRVLMVEDSETDAKLILRALAASGHCVEPSRVDSREAMAAALQLHSWDVILSDWSLPGFGARQALALVHDLGLDTPFIIVSGMVGEEAAVEAMRAGARDYVLKDNLARLAPAIERELIEAELRRQAGERLRSSEEQLRQAQKMEAIGSLAGGIAHDFNNLLTVILSYSSLLATAFDPSDPRRADVLQINEAGERAAALTQQLLAFSRRQVLKPELVRLGDLIGNTEKLLRRLIGEHIELQVRCAPELWPVLVDPGQIDQVLLNLAVNARDAMPNGGTLAIEASNTQLDQSSRGGRELPPGGYVKLIVRDTGIGMEAATLARAFEPFFTTKGIGRGTGLGLSTVHGIVEQSGGGISVESKLGAGTAFTIHLPRYEVPAARPNPAEHSARPGPAGGSETILLVEDDDGVRTLAHTILRRLGYRVLEARSGDDALALLDANGGAVDLLLTDVVMPKMSGPQLACQVRRVCPTMRVLFMSGYLDDATLSDELLDPETEILQKPFTPERLANRVREALSSG